MNKQKDSGPSAGGRSSAIQRHRKWGRLAHDPFVPPGGFVGRLAVPRSKHKTILEWTENMEKKKKLEIEATTNKMPNANFTFVPIGHPELTSLCKELSREQDALVYIVSVYFGPIPKETLAYSLVQTTKERGVILSDHVHRVGYHFRTRIVDEAISMFDGLLQLDPNIDLNPRRHAKDKPDLIPQNQDQINKQADAAIRDLYPRIPNTDREMIIRHAFQKGAVFNGRPVVGLQMDLTLSRRVQLAVVAHIRHTHTRYDMLLRETFWENARRIVEPVCLDILVKWRGDEETGRDQLDEILREIVVIDDSDDDNEDFGSEEGEVEADDSPAINKNGPALSTLDAPGQISNSTVTAAVGSAIASQIPGRAEMPENGADAQMSEPVNLPAKTSGIASSTRSTTGVKPSTIQKKARRGKKRLKAWQDALNRRNQRPTGPRTPFEPPPGSTAIEINSSPVATQGNFALEQNSSTAQNGAPPNLEYQSIYAIDGSRGPSRLKMRRAPSPRIVVLHQSPRNQDLLMSYRQDSGLGKRNFDYDPRHTESKFVSNGLSRPQTSFSDDHREVAPRDMALPSIEPPAEVPSEAPVRVASYGSPQYPKVRYQEFDDRRHPPPARSNISYADGWEEENEAKRRRMVVSSDSSLIPIAIRNSDSYFRLLPTSKVDHPSLIAPPLRRAVNIRDVEAQDDIVPMTENGFNHPGYPRRIVTPTSRDDNMAYTVESRDQRGDNPERPFIIDDSPPLVRVVRRPYTQTYSRSQEATEPEIYRIHRAEGQDYYRQRSPELSIRASHQEVVKPVDRGHTARPVFLARAPPNSQQRVATEMSYQTSPFPSHSRSREMNSGQIFHQFSTSSDGPESRFSSSRHQPMIVDSVSSQLLPPGRHSGDNFQSSRPHGGQELHRDLRFGEVSRMEPRYIPMNSQSRALRADHEYVPDDSRDRVIHVVRL